MPTIDDARAWYPLDDPVHGFDHVLRVYRMAERLALAEGGDLEIVQAAVLLHDATGGNSMQDEGNRDDHHNTSAKFALQVLLAEGWGAERIAAVQHCIQAHRFRDDSEQPKTLEAKILFDADKLDAIGAIGVARSIAYAVLDKQPVFEHPSEQFLRTGEKEPGEPHTPYHEFVFKLRTLKGRMYTRSARAIAEERHRFLEDYFAQLNAEVRGDS